MYVKKGRSFLETEYQLINVERLLELEKNHHLAAIITKIGQGQGSATDAKSREIF